MKIKITGQRQKTSKLLQALFPLLCAGLFVTGCGEKITPGAAQVQRPVVSGVSVAIISPILVDEYYETAGTVKAANISYVSGRMMGTVTSLFVREGDAVEKGQLLLTIDDRDVVQKMKQAESGYQEATKALESAGQSRELSNITFQRYKKMYEEKAISEQEMNQFETQKKVAGMEYERMQGMVSRAAAALAEAKVYLDFTKITSPVKGLVTEKKIQAGSMAAPGVPLLTVESTDLYNAEVTVDERLSGKLKAGTPVVVSIDALNRQMAGKITEVLPAVDSLSRSFTVKVALSGAGLRSGLYINVRIVQGKKGVILVPRTAIVEKGQLAGVYTVDNQDIVTYRLIRTGKNYAGNVEILSGLKPADRIIVKGVEKAVDGGIMGKN
jgi:RND family efflux transporter MFP subunit